MKEITPTWTQYSTNSWYRLIKQPPTHPVWYFCLYYIQPLTTLVLHTC